MQIKKKYYKKRRLGQPSLRKTTSTSYDVQQLNKIYEPIFSDNSYGFRPNRSAQDAVLKAKEIMNNGYKWVVDLDLII